MRQIHRFVAPALRLRPQVARQEIRAVRLDQQPLRRDRAHDFAQMHPTALVADPTGDTDVQAEIEVSARLVDSRREAMRDAADEARSVLAEDRLEFDVQVSYMV